MTHYLTQLCLPFYFFDLSNLNYIYPINFHKKNNVFVHNKKIGKRIKNEWLKLAKKHKLKIEVNGLDTIINFNFLYKNKNDYLITLFTELMLKENILANNTIYISYSHKKSIVSK